MDTTDQEEEDLLEAGDRPKSHSGLPLRLPRVLARHDRPYANCRSGTS